MPNAPCVSTVLVGGDQLVREALLHLGEQLGLSPCIAAGSFAELFALPEPAPDIELIIVLGQAPSAAELKASTDEIRETWPGSRIILLADHLSPGLVERAIRGCVDGVIARDVSVQRLMYSIRLVMLGETLLPGAWAVDMLRQFSAGRSDAKPVDGLTEREGQILALLTQGQSNKCIANKLHTTEATVKMQLRRALRKIGAKNRTQAAIWSLSHLPSSDTDTACPDAYLGQPDAGSTGNGDAALR